MKKTIFIACLLLTGCATTHWEPDGDIRCQDLGLKKGSKEHVACAMHYDQMQSNEKIAHKANMAAAVRNFQEGMARNQVYIPPPQYNTNPIMLNNNNHMNCTSRESAGTVYTNCN